MMRRLVALVAIASLALPTVSVFAQDDLVPTLETPASETETTMSSATDTSAETPTESSSDAMNAAPNTNAVSADSTSLGEYQSVECSVDAIFGQNGCHQCFLGRSVKVGERLSGLFDNWTNSTTNYLIAVKDEQKTPNMVAFDSTWTPTSGDESKMWKSSPEINWVPGTSGKEEFSLLPGQKVRFMETDLGAGFTLEKSSKKNGETIGLLRFPVVYYTMDMSTVTRSEKSDTHYECVKYTLDAPETPTTPEKPKTPPTPEQTKTKTGPTETLVLIIAAFFIAFGLMISLRKRG